MSVAKRHYYLDFLRIIAIFFVLFNHRECYHHFLSYNDFGLKYLITIIPSILCKCGPPLFFMISGALLLKDKEESFLQIFKHRIVRILIVMVVAALWKSRESFTVVTIIKTFASGLNWYLYAYLGFLFMLPFLRAITNHISKQKVTLFFFLVFGFYSAQALSIALGQNFLLFANVPIFNAYHGSSCWMIIFPVAGYFLANLESICEDKKTANKMKLALVGASVFSLVASITLMTYDIRNNNSANLEQLRQHFIFAPSCMIFYFTKVIVEKFQHKISNVPAKIITEISAATFGMYILEVFTKISENLYNYVAEICTPIIGTYFSSFVSIAISFVIYIIIVVPVRKIPFINKII